MLPAKYFTLIYFVALNSTLVFSQSFIAAVSEFQSSDDCIMELVNGSTVTGKISMATIINGNLSSVTLKDDNGNKHKHKAETIKQLKVKMGFLAKLDAATEASSSLAEMFQADFKEIINREYIIYEQALIPKKKDKYRLLQLVNPGFDNAIKVYDDPSGNETGGVGLGDVQLTGGKEKSYLVVINGAKAVKVKKGKYKKLFPEIYGDCPEVIKIIGESKIKFKDMAAHVFAYDQLCGGT
jgi:hypothetical protein